jgi:hypothetical protein
MLESIPGTVFIQTELGERLIYLSVFISVDLLDSRNNFIPQQDWKGNFITIHPNPFTSRRHEGSKKSVITCSSTNTQGSSLHIGTIGSVKRYNFRKHYCKL